MTTIREPPVIAERSATVLIVTDDGALAAGLRGVLASAHTGALVARNVAAALKALAHHRVDALFVAAPLASAPGLEFLDDFALAQPGVPVVLLEDGHLADHRSRRAEAILARDHLDPEVALEVLARLLGEGHDEERRRAEERHSEALAEATGMSFGLISASGRIVRASHSFPGSQRGTLSAVRPRRASFAGRARRESPAQAVFEAVMAALASGEVQRRPGPGAAFEVVAVPLALSGERDPYGVVVAIRNECATRPLVPTGPSIEALFSPALSSSAQAAVVIDEEGRIARVNAAAGRLFERDAQGLLGVELATLVPAPDRAYLEADLAALFSVGIAWTAREQRFVRPDGHLVTAALDAVVLGGETEGRRALLQGVDVSELRAAEAALSYHASHDTMTGLANRAQFYERFDAALADGAAHDPLALAFVDIDRFKLVNETLGHLTGDQVLVDVARRLAGRAAPGDMVARFGSDQFLLARRVVDTDAARCLGDELVAAFAEPFPVTGQALYLSASVGVALVEPGTGVDTVLRDADAALQAAKHRGGAHAEVFATPLRRSSAVRFELQQALAVALERDQLRVVYQPIVDLEGATLLGVEALVRWDHPGRGLLLPGQFIEAAEQTGMIGPLGQFVLAESLAQVMHWRTVLPGASDLWVAVNLSARQLFLGDPVRECAGALAEADAPPQALRLELTESTVMEEVDASIERLSDLQAIGVKIAIDDFGTGHSSLSYLSRLPVSALKIDHSFVWSLGANRGDSAIVDAIVSMAEAMDLELCAEGVETPGQRDRLLALGCGVGQGYLFAAPMDPAALQRWAARHHAVDRAPFGLLDGPVSL